MKYFNKFLTIKIVIFLFISIVGINLFLRLSFKNYSLLDRCVTNSFKIENFKEYKGVLYINDSLKLATSYNNDTLPIKMLYEYIQVKDSISLEAGKDTLYLYSGNKKHWFIYYGDPCDE